MLTPVQSNVVVKACVKAVSGRDSLVEQRLNEVGIVTKEHVDLLVGEIVKNQEIGVRKFGHQIKASALNDVKPTAKVGEVSDTVKAKATPLG